MAIFDPEAEVSASWFADESGAPGWFDEDAPVAATGGGVVGTLDQAAPLATVTAAGVVPVAGTAAMSAPLPGVGASGVVPVAGAMSGALPAPSAVATGAVPVSAGLSQGAPLASLAASGAVTVAGELAGAMAAPVVAAAGGVEVAAQLDAAVAMPGLDASAGVVVAGQADAGIAPPGLAAAGVTPILGLLDEVVPLADVIATASSPAPSAAVAPAPAAPPPPPQQGGGGSIGVGWGGLASVRSARSSTGPTAKEGAALLSALRRAGNRLDAKIGADALLGHWQSVRGELKPEGRVRLGRGGRSAARAARRARGGTMAHDQQQPALPPVFERAMNAQAPRRTLAGFGYLGALPADPAAGVESACVTPSTKTAGAFVRGDPGAGVAFALATLGRAVLIAPGLYVAGVRGPMLVKASLGAAGAISLYILLYLRSTGCGR